MGNFSVTVGVPGTQVLSSFGGSSESAAPDSELYKSYTCTYWYSHTIDSSGSVTVTVSSTNPSDNPIIVIYEGDNILSLVQKAATQGSSGYASCGASLTSGKAIRVAVSNITSGNVACLSFDKSFSRVSTPYYQTASTGYINPACSTSGAQIYYRIIRSGYSSTVPNPNGWTAYGGGQVLVGVNSRVEIMATKSGMIGSYVATQDPVP